jgi:MFS transporter, DHA1 family, tetracycline resistance protein
VPARNRQRRPLPPGFGVIWTTVALDLVGFGILFPVLPRVAADSGASPTQAGLLVASFSLAQLLFAPLWGRVSDRVGRKPVLLVSLVGTAVGSLLTGLALGGVLWLLFLARILDGVSGASVSVAQASVTDLASPEERPRLLGLLGAAFGAGFALGPAIGGLAALVSPRLPFFVAGGIAAANAAVAVRRLPETRQQYLRQPSRPDPAVAAPASAGPAVATAVTSTSPAGARVNGLVQLVLASFVAVVAFSAFEATFALLTERRFGLSESATYGVFFGIGIALVVVQGGLIHTVAVALGEEWTIRVGLLGNAVGLALMAPDAGWWSLGPGLAFLVLGQGLVAPTLASAVAGRARREGRGMVLGLQQSAGGMARVAGPVAGTFLFQHAGVPAPYVLGATFSVAALVLVPENVTAEEHENQVV